MSTNETPLLWPQYQAGVRKGRHLHALAVTASLLSIAQRLAGWLRTLNRAIVRLIDDLAARRKQLRAVRALHKLDDHALHDIGISRGEIEYVVRHGREERRPNVVTMPRRAPLAAPDFKQAA
jgi:uncharacterized protein YjiS (DUF1127 family)